MRTFIALWLSLSATSPVLAADALVGTRGEMSETKHQVRITVDRGHARLVVRRTVRAEGNRHDQAVYMLSMPEGSVAVGLRTLGVKDGHPIWYAGELMEAQAAAAKYRELTGFGSYYPKDPALLSWRSEGHLALQVFPVAPRAEKTIEYSMVLPTQYEHGHDLLVLGDLGLEGRRPDIVLEAARPEDRLWLNGQPYPNGSAMPWPSSTNDGAPRDELAANAPSGDGELRILLVRGGNGRLAGRLAAVPLSAHGGLVHFRVEAAKRFSRLPHDLSMVVLVDKSYSVAPADREAGLVAISQVLDRVPEARVAILAFDRKVTPLWKGFLPAPAALDSLDEAELASGNGSHVDEALRAAKALLAQAPKGRERRIYLLSDLLTRSALAVPSLAKTVKETTALLHVGVMSEGEATLEPFDGSAWADVARATGGLCWHGQARDDAANLATVFEEWVRPTRLHRFALAGFAPGTTNRLDQLGDRGDTFTLNDDAGSALPVELPEGTAFEYGGLPLALPRRIVVRGELWARPISYQLTSTAEQERLWSALVFGTSFYQELSEREMMTLAMRGRAVSPVTSYLAIEPGVRPSTEGLEEGTGTGGGGSGEGTIGLGGFGMSSERRFDAEAHLRARLVKARAECGQADSSVSVRIETTKHEIVDVPAVSLDRGHDASCLREAIWAWELPGDFTDERATYAISLPAASKA